MVSPSMLAKSPCDLLLVTIIFFLLTDPSTPSPPPAPVQCIKGGTTNCTVTNAYGTFPDRSTCHALKVVYPTSEQELIKFVADATATKTKMKVSTRFSHSIPKLSCPGGSDGLIISTLNLDHVLNIDDASMQITVESGVTLQALIEAAAEANLVIPHTPYFSGLTIGGLLSTGAHGSSLTGKGSSVHEYVTEMRLVTPAPANQGYASVRVLKLGDPNLDAAKVSLGVLGVISQITLQLEPMFKRSLTFLTSNDSDLADQAVNFGDQYEFADLAWYPGQKKVVYRRDSRVSVNVSGSGTYEFLGIRQTATSDAQANRYAEDAMEMNKDADRKCQYSQLITSTVASYAYGLTNNGLLFAGYPVVGYQNKMATSGSCAYGSEDGLQTACSWDPRIDGAFFHQTAVSIQLNRVKEFILDMQKLRDLQPNALCGLELYGGVLMRYIKASSAYLGKDADVLEFDFTYYRSRDPMSPRLYEDFIEEIEQMVLIKYGGFPHWGKNRNLAFDGVIKKYKNSQAFLKVKEMYDPDGLFSSEWSDQVLGINGSVIVDSAGCALEGLCICSEDVHCAPDQGYYCRPGKVYTAARVCTYVDPSNDLKSEGRDDHTLLFELPEDILSGKEEL